MLHLLRSFICCWNMDISKEYIRNTSKDLKCGAGKNGENQLERSCEEVSITKNQGGKEHTSYDKTKKG